jgi:hypothetical protein
MHSTTWTPIDDPYELNDVRLRLLLSHWTAAAANGRLPSTAMIDPRKLGEVMGWMYVIRVERDPLRFLYLSTGDKIVRRIGFNPVGMYLDQHPDPSARDAITGLFTAVVTTARPHRAGSVRRLLDRDLVTQAVVLPLAGADGTVDHLLALQILDTPANPGAPGAGR